VIWEGKKDVEVDVLGEDDQTYTFLIKRCETEAKAIKRAIKMHGKPSKWAGNVRLNTPLPALNQRRSRRG
jgi:hypothetical protein